MPSRLSRLCQRLRRRWLLLGAIVFCGFLGRSFLRIGLYSIYFLQGLSNPGQPTWLDPLLARTIQKQEAVTRLDDGEALRLELYQPEGTGPWPALLVVPGFDQLGLRDPRMIGLARLLARAGVLVVMPDLTELFEYRFSARLLDRIEAAFVHMADLPAARQDKLGLFGLSISGGFALAAATRPNIATRLDYALAFAPFHDHASALEFGFTGRHSFQGQTFQRPPSPFSHWILLYNFLHLALPEQHPDFPLAQEILRLRIHGQGIEAAHKTNLLSPDTRALLSRLENDPETLDQLTRRVLQHTPEGPQLSPRTNLCNLRGRLFVLHGRQDDVLPYTESLSLQQQCAACPDLDCDVLITGLYSHADRDVEFDGIARRLQQQVPETARYLGFLYRVVQEMLGP